MFSNEVFFTAFYETRSCLRMSAQIYMHNIHSCLKSNEPGWPERAPHSVPCSGQHLSIPRHPPATRTGRVAMLPLSLMAMVKTPRRQDLNSKLYELCFSAP